MVGAGVDSEVGESVASDGELLLLLEQPAMRNSDTIAAIMKSVPEILGFRL
ncbi:hypothetical protein D3C76_1538160 [compost metagenome]